MISFPSVSQRRGSWIAVITVEAVLVCLSALAQRPLTEPQLKKSRLVVPAYPSADIEVGALKFGDLPKRPANSTIGPEYAFTRTLYERLNAEPIAFEDTKRAGKFGVDLAFSPGPAVLQAAKLSCGKAGISFSKDSLKFVDWGRLTETTLDLHTLTEACIRGWLDLPGPALHRDALLKLQLNMDRATQRPWIVTRAVVARGLRYGLAKESGIKFDLGATHPAIGTGALGLGYRVKNERTLEVDQAMGIGFDAVLLESITAPLPSLQATNALKVLDGPTTFYWRRASGGDPEPVSVNIAALRIADGRPLRADERPLPAAADACYPADKANLVVRLNALLKSGKPVAATVVAESRRGRASAWRVLNEGDEFHTDEELRLRVVLDQPGFVYVLTKDGTGRAAVLHPKVAGEDFSEGEEKQLPAGEWRYPEALGANEALTYVGSQPGTESFVVIVTQTRLEGLPLALADFAGAARQLTQTATRGLAGDYAFASVLRLPTGKSKMIATAAAPGVAANSLAPNTATPTTPTTNAPPTEVPLFSGVNTATILKLNLRLTAPPKAEATPPPAATAEPGLQRLVTGKQRSEVPEGDREGARIVDTLDYYKDLPPGPYRNIWGLFIGVGRYADEDIGELENPPKDAEALAAAFQKVCGMREARVLINEQATLANVTAALRELGAKDGPGDLFVLHFSGHGVGLDNESGRMLLHDAKLGTLRAAAAEGVLEMTLLGKLLADARIDSKHQLLLLDCCYSGMGKKPPLTTAQTRSVFGHSTTHDGEVREEDRRDNMLQLLDNRALCIVSAGGAGQPVLDGGYGDLAGHGLLSGYLLQALEKPEAFHFQAIRYDGAEYVPLREIFQAGSEVIRSQARRIMLSSWEHWKEQQAKAGGQRAVTLASRDAMRGGDVFSRIRSEQELNAKVIQNPQQSNPEEGEVYLPLGVRRQDAAPANNAPSAEAPAAPTPEQVHRSFSEWANAVGKRYGNPGYGAALEKVFELLNAGRPAGRAGVIEIQAELECRYLVTSKTANQSFSFADLQRTYGSLSDDPNIRLQLAVEDWRQKTAGADWFVMPQLDGLISPNYELQFRLRNTGKVPLHYYVIGHDAAGVLQWLAPANDSAPEAGYTAGSNPLAPGSEQIVPEVRRVAGRLLGEGWPVISGMDQQFFVVATLAPWPEFETALRTASRTGFELAQRIEKHDPLPATPLESSLPMPASGTRAVGKTQKLIADVPASAPESSTANPSPPVVVTRAEGTVLVQIWQVKALPAERMKPEFVPQ
jgi:hypothetical protein